MKTLRIDSPRLTQINHRNFNKSLEETLSNFQVTSRISVAGLELLGPGHEGVLLDFVRKTMILSDIRTINVICPAFDLTGRLQDFFDSTRSNLESARLDISQLWNEDLGNDAVVNLSLNSSLHTLHLHISMNTSSENENWSMVADILQLAPPSLSCCVIIGIEMNAPAAIQLEFDSVNWERFEDALGRLNDLRKVVFCRENVRLGAGIYKIFPLDEMSRKSVLGHLVALPPREILRWSL